MVPCPHFSWDLIHVKRRQVYCRTLAFPGVEAVRRKGVASGLLFSSVPCHPAAEMATPSLLNFVLC